jgi:hypothetical protein
MGYTYGCATATWTRPQDSSVAVSFLLSPIPAHIRKQSDQEALASEATVMVPGGTLSLVRNLEKRVVGVVPLGGGNMNAVAFETGARLEAEAKRESNRGSTQRTADKVWSKRERSSLVERMKPLKLNPRIAHGCLMVGVSEAG